MNSLLTHVDIYGIQIPFTFYGKTQYNSLCGGTLTLITLLIMFFLSLHEMAPIYYRQDPQLFNKMIDPDNFTYYNLSYTKFPIAFRFEDELKTLKNLDQIVYTYVELIHLKQNKSTGNMVLQEKKQISYSDCTESLINREIYANLNGFKCLNFSEFDKQVGGAIYAEDAIYFKITVFFCALVNGKHENCTDFKTLSRELSGSRKIYFTLLVPDVSINPDDFEKPLKVSLDAYINTLSPIIMRTDRYYYNYMKMEQDAGLVFEDTRYMEGFSFNRKDVEYQIRTLEDYEDPSKIKTLSTNVFAFDKRIFKLKVVFKRLQAGLADVGGLIKIFTLVFALLNRFVMDDFKFLRLIDDLFDIRIDKRKVQSIFEKEGRVNELNKKIESDKLKNEDRRNNKNHNGDIIKDANSLKGLYIDINELKINQDYKRIKLVIKEKNEYIELENFAIANNLIEENINNESNRKSDSNIQKNTLFRNEIKHIKDLSEQTNIKAENNNESQVILKNKSFNNLDKSSFRDLVNKNEDEVLNKASKNYINSDSNKIENNKDKLKSSNLNENKIDENSFFPYDFSIKDIFDVKEKIKLLLFKHKKTERNNFKIYHDGKEKIAEKMDIINYLKMSFKFEEMIDSIENKIIKSSSLYNFQKEFVYLD